MNPDEQKRFNQCMEYVKAIQKKNSSAHFTGLLMGIICRIAIHNYDLFAELKQRSQTK
jgi:hypothetical protein